MGISLEKIKEPIIDELQNYQRYFKTFVKSNTKLLNVIVNYMLKNKGKELRPILTILFAKAYGEVNSKTYVGATLMQLLHSATLLHDDVVDNAFIRRGRFTVNALWKPKTAVLVGDYLLSKGMLIALDNAAYDLLQLASNAVKEMSEGELLQLQKARKLNITEKDYFIIIKKKTASLISSCITIGAKSVNAPKDVIIQLQELGLNLGIAFQLKDDLLDFQHSKSTGKLSLNDIKEKKFTLPIIYTIQESSKKEQQKLLYKLKKNSSNKRKLKEIVEQITRKGGIEYTEKKMKMYQKKALEILEVSVKDNPLKTTIKELIYYTIERNK